MKNLILIALFCATVAFADKPAPRAPPLSIPEIVAMAKPAVVEILVYDQNGNSLGTGTAFFISADGVALTNYHVISGATKIFAKTADGKIHALKSVRGYSQPSDVAELQFDTLEVSFLTLALSTNAVEGQRILVIGNPEGLEGTVSDGIISAFRANRSYIQITAPISPGSSGSPVLDDSGQVIGMATLTRKEGQNLNLAISSETIKAMIAESDEWNSVGTIVWPPPVAKATPTPTPHQIQPSSPEALTLSNKYFDRAQNEAGAGNWIGAISDFTTSIELYPEVAASAHDGRGYCYQVLKQYQKAISDFTEAMRLYPGWYLPYRNRAIVYEIIGNHAAAARDRQRAKELRERNK
jgi:Trypsin-like peptidase domain/Tetratricopeptide repeat